MHYLRQSILFFRTVTVPYGLERCSTVKAKKLITELLWIDSELHPWRVGRRPTKFLQLVILFNISKSWNYEHVSLILKLRECLSSWFDREFCLHDQQCVCITSTQVYTLDQEKKLPEIFINRINTSTSLIHSFMVSSFSKQMNVLHSYSLFLSTSNIFNSGKVNYHEPLLVSTNFESNSISLCGIIIEYCNLLFNK